MSNNGTPSGAEFAYEVGVRALDAQSRRVDSLDTKAAVILAVDGVLTGLLFQRGDAMAQIPKPMQAVAILLLLGSLSLRVCEHFGLANTRRHHSWTP